MGKVADAVHDLFPGLPSTELYDDEYPDNAAGHVEAGPYTSDGDVTTQHGVDIGFDGDDVPGRTPRSGGQEVGATATNRRIDETAEKSKHETKRRPVTNVAASVVYGNETLPDTQPRRILMANRNRKQVTVTNQGGTLIAVGKGGNINISGGAPSPNAAYLPNGSALSVRVFTQRDEVWVVGSAGGVVDWVEENYS